jgi:hypothetical protein
MVVVVAYKKKNCCKKTTATSTSKKDPYVEKPPTKTLSTLCKFFVAQIFRAVLPVRNYK